MFLVVANVDVKPGESESFLKCLDEYIAILMENEPGTLYFDVYKKSLNNKEGAEEYVILEGYKDEDAYDDHVNSHFRLEHLEKIRAHLSDGAAAQFKSVEA